MRLIKLSDPGWEKKFVDKQELIDELRKHICHSCRFTLNDLVGVSDEEFDEEIADHYPIVDVEYNGVVYECRDIPTLLSTSCGCEYTIDYEDDII